MNEVIYVAIMYFLRLISYAIIANAILSYLPVPKHHILIRLLYQITEPILTPIRNALYRTSFGSRLMIDISPIIALVLIQVIEQILAKLLFGL